MVRQRSTPRPLSREHLSIWWDAFQIAWSAALRKDGDAIERALAGITRAATQAAWSALDSYRAASRGDRR